MASLQELQANYNAAFDALPVGQRINWGGGTIFNMGGGRMYYDGPQGYQVLTKGQDVAQIAASDPNIAKQWAGEGYNLAPAQTMSTRPEQVVQAPTAQTVAAPSNVAEPTAIRSAQPQFSGAAQYFGQGPEQAGFTGTYKDPKTGKYMLPRYETRYDPMVGDTVSTQVGWYEADGQNVGDMMRAYDNNGNADASKNVAIQDTSDTLLDKLIKGGILAGTGMGLGQLAGIGGQVAGAGDAFMPGALDATGAVIGDATMPGALASFGANPATTSLGALAVGTGDAFLPGALNAATGTILGDAYLPGALGSFGANPALTGTTGPLALGGLGGGTAALSSGTAGVSGAGVAGTGTGSAAGVIGPATTGPEMMGPPTTATTPAGLEQYLKKPSLIDTLGSALGVNGSTAATLLGGLLGSQSSGESKTTANKLDPQMQAYLYGSEGLLPAVNSTLQSQLANGGLNDLQRQGLTTQQNYLQSPEYAQQFNQLRNYGQGLLASGVAANPFATRGTNGLL